MANKRRQKGKKSKFLTLILSALAIIAVAIGGFYLSTAIQSGLSNTTAKSSTTSSSATASSSTYQVSEEEKAYLAQRFSELSAINPETVGYVYIPGTMLDEPVVQTTDNSTYLDKTFDGGYEPYMGTVFMDMDNSKDFSNELTWLFGHARGSQVEDHRMFNDVNFYDSKEYMDTHKYAVIETPERKHYYEVMFLVIVPETTAFYRTSFDSKEDFKNQLTQVAAEATVKSDNIVLNENDKYLVLSTCREEDETIRSNLYLREIPDEELTDFLAQHASELTYTATR